VQEEGEVHEGAVHRQRREEEELMLSSHDDKEFMLGEEIGHGEIVWFVLALVGFALSLQFILIFLLT